MFASRLVIGMAVAVVVAALFATVAADAATSGLALLGALVVAIVTAEAADNRQARQLDAERKRTRELADLADLRQLLDDAARAVHCAKEACPSVERLADTEDHNVSREFQTAIEQLMVAQGRLEHVTIRLSIRLARKHEITAAVLAIQDAVIEMASALAWFAPPGVHRDPEEDWDDTDSSAERERVAKARVAIFRHRREFEAAVIRVAGSRIDA